MKILVLAEGNKNDSRLFIDKLKELYGDDVIVVKPKKKKLDWVREFKNSILFTKSKHI